MKTRTKAKGRAAGAHLHLVANATAPSPRTPAAAADAEPTTLASVAYERMRRDVSQGRFPPGARLRIETLVDMYQVGRSPIREALNRLASEALIVQEDQRGFRMPAVSLEDLEELTRTRCWVYEIGLRESIARGSTAWEESVVLSYYRLSRLERCKPEVGLPTAEQEQIHRGFHAALISACESRWIISLAEKLFDLADRYRSLALMAQEYERDGPAEHAAIKDAVLERNVPLAVELMNRHITLTAELVQKSIAGLTPKASR